MPATDPPPLLRVHQLTTHLQIGANLHRVVDQLSFDLHPGKTLALVGESGCGKSMTALSLMRIAPSPPVLYSEGVVWFEGQNLLELRESEMRRIRGMQMAMIFQDPSSSLNPVYTIGDQLLEVAHYHLDITEDEATERIIQALQEVGISAAADRMDHYPHQLSGGMKQRVMIAMALLCQPKILIADEPTTALDVTVQAQVLDLIRELQLRTGMALLLITHDLGVVAEMADEVIVMYASQAVERADVQTLFNAPAHPYTQGLFQSRPTANSAKGHLKPIHGTVPPLGHYPKGCHFYPRCPYAMPVCKHGTVPYFSTPQPGQETKCWLSSPEYLKETTHDAS